MSRKRKTNWPLKNAALYFICDPALLRSGSLLAVTKKAVAGGANIVQLRDKFSSAAVFLKEAVKLAEFLRKKKIPFIVNDRVDVALICGAAGVHLGPADIPIPQARKQMGEGKIIGASAHTVAQAKRAEQAGADYIGAGQVFHTTTKGITQHPISVKTLAAIRRAVSIPVVAIGGIKAGNTASVMESGCDGIAVVSAIMSSKNPKKAAQRLMKVINS